jgi:hypothetical protein
MVVEIITAITMVVITMETEIKIIITIVGMETEMETTTIAIL